MYEYKNDYDCMQYAIQRSSFNEQHLHKTMLYQVAQFQIQFLKGPPAS